MELVQNFESVNLWVWWKDSSSYVHVAQEIEGESPIIPLKATTAEIQKESGIEEEFVEETETDCSTAEKRTQTKEDDDDDDDKGPPPKKAVNYCWHCGNSLYDI